MLPSTRLWWWRFSPSSELVLATVQPLSHIQNNWFEGVVKCPVTDHLVSSGLLNPHQSAYCKHYSTETALLYIHDRLFSAIGSQKLSCLCLLDFSVIPPPFTPDLKPICSTNPFIHSLSGSTRSSITDLGPALDLGITNPGCHGNEIWDKIGYNLACIRDISEIVAPSWGYSGSCY